MVLLEAGMVATLWLAALAHPAPPQSKAQVQKEILALEFRLCDLLVRGDLNRYAENLDPSYVRTSDGVLETREQVLADMRATAIRPVKMEPESLEVRAHGTTAVLTGRLRWTGQGPDGIVKIQSRFTKVFVRAPRGWRLVALHSTTVGP